VSKLPVISGEELIKALQKAGFTVVCQKGSHVSLQNGPYMTIVPLHEELAKGALLSILKQCGLSKEDLLELLT